MSGATTVLVLGALAAGAYFLFRGHDYFVEESGGHYEYFKDEQEARTFARTRSGSKLYQIPKGSEFDEKSALRLTPNRSKRKKRRRRR